MTAEIAREERMAEPAPLAMRMHRAGWRGLQRRFGAPRKTVRRPSAHPTPKIWAVANPQPWARKDRMTASALDSVS
jgi:hypothetical protein